MRFHEFPKETEILEVQVGGDFFNRFIRKFQLLLYFLQHGFVNQLQGRLARSILDNDGKIFRGDVQLAREV